MTRRGGHLSLALRSVTLCSTQRVALMLVRLTANKADDSCHNVRHQYGAALQAADLAAYDPPTAASVAIVASYEPSDGARDDLGRLRFDDHPEFTPSLTPKQVRDSSFAAAPAHAAAYMSCQTGQIA